MQNSASLTSHNQLAAERMPRHVFDRSSCCLQCGSQGIWRALLADTCWPLTLLCCTRDAVNLFTSELAVSMHHGIMLAVDMQGPGLGPVSSQEHKHFAGLGDRPAYRTSCATV